jgi:hypothetical protein
VDKIAWHCDQDCAASRNFAHAVSPRRPGAWATRRHAVPYNSTLRRWRVAHPTGLPIEGVTAMKQEPRTKVGRREFLRTLGVGASAAVAGAGPLAGEARADTETDSEKRKPRYRETEHVKAYYRVNRYPK